MIDTSAWVRAPSHSVRASWQSAMIGDQMRLSPVARIEFLITARDGASFDELRQGLASLRPVPLTRSITDAAEAAMRTLSYRSAGAHRLPLTDYLLAASAQEIGGAVLHYDQDFDLLAEIMSFESVWIAPRGSL